MDPLKLQQAGYLGLRPPVQDTKSEKTRKGEGKSRFDTKLHQAQEEDRLFASQNLDLSEAELERLLDAVHEAGQDLVKNPVHETIRKYREKVSQFMKRIVDLSYDLEENEGRLRKDLKKPKYALIQVVNSRLDKLATAVLGHERERLDILGRVNEIQGMLVDLKT